MPSLSNELLQALMMLGGMGLLCWTFIRSRMRKRAGRVTAPAAAATTIGLKYNSQATIKPSNFSGLRSMSAPAEALQWQLDLHDLGRELKAELDCKLLAVREMTAAYDRASRRLLALIHAAERDAPAQLGILKTIETLKSEGLSRELIANRVGLSETDVEELSLLNDIRTRSE